MDTFIFTITEENRLLNTEPADMVIYTDVPDAASKPSGWLAAWNQCNTTVGNYTTIYNTSESEFDAIVQATYYPEPVQAQAQPSDLDNAMNALNTLGVNLFEDIEE